jgi:gamma-glutamylcyclotransferase (GGCT)/AIG2-like uncharacterized protein YtfP
MGAIRSERVIFRAVHYFGYGSNLHRTDFERWCRERGHCHDGVRVVGPAWLPDAEPVFHYRSKARRGGALNIRPRRGSAVPGLLFEVDEAGWRALDAKEGRPRFYERVERLVLTADGEERTAITYEVVEDHRRDEHVPPTDEYARVVREGLAAHGLPQHHIEAAALGFDAPPVPRALFVYGTLMRGERAHARIERHRPSRIADATVSGRLVSLGEYPGLVGCDEGGEVRGELVELDDPADLVAELDPFEDFLGYGERGSLYRRVVVQVTDDEGRRTPAWTYRYIAPIDEAPAIDSGDWRRR